MTRALIVLRCGRNSLHADWTSSPDRNFDLVLCPYEPVDTRGVETTIIPGQKWDGLMAFFATFDRWRDYDYICLPDDDLATNQTILNGFIQFCADRKIQLAAPALTPDSYFSYPVTMQNQNFVARRTTFVEVMAPCFSAQFFPEALRTFKLSRSGTGFGLDYLWSCMLSYQNIWISDAHTIHHTRPVGGTLRNERMAELSLADLRFITDFGVPRVITTIGGIGKDGFHHDAADPGFAELVRSGYAYLPRRGPRIEQSLTQVVPAIPLHVGERLAASLRHLEEPDRTISRGRPSRVSSLSQWSWSTDPEIEAGGANDGRLNGCCGFHTELESNPWWQVDLGARHAISDIAIYNRLDQPQRFIDFDILVSDDGDDWRSVFSRRQGRPFGGADGTPFRHGFCPRPVARFLRVTAVGTNFMHLDQVEVFGEPAGPADGAVLPAAAHADQPPSQAIEDHVQTRGAATMSEQECDGMVMRALTGLLRTPAASELVADCVQRQVFGMHRDSLDIDRLAWFAAAITSGEFVQEEMSRARRLPRWEELMTDAISAIRIPGLVMEFGVSSGHSINFIAERLAGQTVYGFDSFEGLPTEWRPGYPAGTFARENLPSVAPNIELVVGWFDRSLPVFLERFPERPAALLHIDCDLYSSTQTVLSQLSGRIVPGTVIVFDEYFNYPGWRKHEHKAFSEFRCQHGLHFEWLGFIPTSQQAYGRVLG